MCIPLKPHCPDCWEYLDQCTCILYDDEIDIEGERADRYQSEKDAEECETSTGSNTS